MTKSPDMRRPDIADALLTISFTFMATGLLDAEGSMLVFDHTDASLEFRLLPSPRYAYMASAPPFCMSSLAPSSASTAALDRMSVLEFLVGPFSMLSSFAVRNVLVDPSTFSMMLPSISGTSPKTDMNLEALTTVRRNHSTELVAQSSTLVKLPLSSRTPLLLLRWILSMAFRMRWLRIRDTSATRP